MLSTPSSVQHILIVEDEPDLLDLYKIALSPLRIPIIGCYNLTELKAQFPKYRFGICLTDMRLPDGTGLEVVHMMRNQPIPIPTIMISAFGQPENVVEALRLGASDYLIKPIEHERLRALVKELFLFESVPTHNNLPRTLLGTSPVITHVRQMIEKLAKGLAPVFITGESGTGKERAARMIHDLGPRKNQPFVAVNCGAIPEQLVESEFFGYKKGAFTGADRDRGGFFHAAHGGTLLLDEVAELPLAMQVKLLRVLQERKVRRVGATEEENVDVRILSATHQNLQDLIRDSKFRHDLYYRLNVIELHLPALRERREDLEETIVAMLQVLSQREGVSAPSLSDAFVKQLKNHPLKGNLRELENILERGMMLGFSQDLLTVLSDHATHDTSDTQGIDSHSIPHTTDTKRELLPVEAILALLPEMPFDLTVFLEGVERIALLRALRLSEGNKTVAARLLGLTLRQLRYRLMQLKLD